AYTLSIFNLLSSLTPVGAGISGIERYVGGSGIFGSGIGASVFFLGGDLLYSRVTVATLDTLIALFIGFSLFRRWFFGLVPSILGASIFWGLSVTTPFALPYWHGFIYNLGELPGALVLALGLLLWARRPHLAAFFWGLVAWHTKPLYFPVPMLLTLASAWSFPVPIRGKLSKLASLMSIFLLPLFIWLIFAAVRFGITEAANQVTTIAGFIGIYSESHREFQPLYQLSKIGNPLSLSHLISRLNNLEWAQSFITFGTKLKVVALSLGSVGITLAGLASQRPADRRAFTTLASCALSVMVLAYTYWWFMLHPTMWMRHFQPALYIGFGLWVFWLLQISLRFSLFDRPPYRWGAIAFATTFVIWQAYFSWGISTRISDFPTRWRCPIDSFVLVTIVEATCKKD
ncbi:MAG: hypothetical protein RLY92_638, partial [Chloroflexota bacterium]